MGTMKKQPRAAELRELATPTLEHKVVELAEEIARWRMAGVTRDKSAAPLKKERARILTILRERQLRLAGMRSETDVLRSRRGPVHERQARPKAALLRAKLIANDYPLIVGNKYQLVLQRNGSRAASILQRELFLGFPPGGGKQEPTRFSQSPLLLRCFSEELTISPKQSLFCIPASSQLVLEISPNLAGACQFECVVMSEKNREPLQILRLGLDSSMERNNVK